MIKVSIDRIDPPFNLGRFDLGVSVQWQKNHPRDTPVFFIYLGFWEIVIWWPEE